MSIQAVEDSAVLWTEHPQWWLYGVHPQFAAAFARFHVRNRFHLRMAMSQTPEVEDAAYWEVELARREALGEEFTACQDEAARRAFASRSSLARARRSASPTRSGPPCPAPDFRRADRQHAAGQRDLRSCGGAGWQCRRLGAR